MKSSGIPGMAVAVVHDGKTVYAKGFGVKDVNRPADDRGNASIPTRCSSWRRCPNRSAPTVVAHQVTQNAISWDTPVVDKLPWFALSDPAVTKMVTVGDLYSHRSGLPDHAGDQLEDLGYDRRYVLERLRQLPLDPFRISYAYTNFGLTAAAEAVAVAAGKPWEDLSDEVLYRPLGMTSTSSRFADYEARADKALGHIHDRREVPAALQARRRSRVARRRGQFVGQRPDPLADDDAGQRQVQRAADRRPGRAAARGDPADRVRARPASRRCAPASTVTDSTSAPPRRPGCSSATRVPSISVPQPTS